MENKADESRGGDLPPCAIEFIRQVGRQMRYRRKTAKDVQAELTAHFEDDLHGCTDAQERQQKAQRLIEQFGDARLLAILCRRAKKRCRPLWVRTLKHTMQALGIVLLVFIPYTIWFIRGKAEPTIDYWTQLNALYPLDNRIADDAWPYYQRAMRLYVEPNETFKKGAWPRPVEPPGQVLTAQEQKALADWIAVNSQAWLQFEFAATKKQCHGVLRRSPEGLLGSALYDRPLKNLKNLRGLSQLGVWKSRVAAEQGHIGESLDCCLTTMCAAAHWQKDPFLVEQLVAVAFSAMSSRAILQILASNDLSASELSNLQARLIAVYAEGFPHINFEGERLMVLDAIQRCFTNSGFGGGHRVAMEYAGDLQAAPDEEARIVVAPAGVALSMIHASRSKTIAKANQIYDRLRELAVLTPYERRTEDIPGVWESARQVEMWRYQIVYMLLPNDPRVSLLAYQAKTEYEGLLAVVALKRYRLETGAYPPDLKTLVDARYLNELPMDPFSDGPLVYRPAGDGFLLYSAGRDFKDDGGEPGRDKHGKPAMWREEGDTVFWPVP
jgi:hypothetical protein